MVIGVVLVIDVYALVYYRLLVRYFLKADRGIEETAFAALFTPPPYRLLSDLGRKYAKRYYGAIGVLAACMAAIAWRTDFRAIGTGG
jgi:hypothetical protein